MGRLIFLFGMPGSGYEELLRILQANAPELTQAGWAHLIEEYSWNRTHPRIPSSARMIEMLAEVELGKRDKAESPALMEKCALAAARTKNLLVTGWAPDIAGLKHFLQSKNSYPELKKLAPEAVLLLGRQDRALDAFYRQMVLLGAPHPTSSAMRCARYYNFSNLEEIYSQTRTLVDGNLQVWPHKLCDGASLDPDQRKKIVNLLHLPESSPCVNELMPQSGTGFELALALARLPEYSQNWPENYFGLIRQVEHKLNLQPQIVVPGTLAEDLLAQSGDANAKLASLFGLPELFPVIPCSRYVHDEAELGEAAACFVRLLDEPHCELVARYLRQLLTTPSQPQKMLAESLRQRSRHFITVREPAKISVLTLAHNHEKYIAENIESVLAQSANAKIEHIIVDDASTDATRDIIDSYAAKYGSIRPIYLRERACHGENVKTLFNACGSEYAALCDGDDYLTDNRKLQKQYEFLESHKECALCFHPVDVVYEDGSPSSVYPPPECLPGGVKPVYTIKNLLFANMIQTNSVMYRWRFQNGLPTWFDPTLIPADWYWHLLHAEQGFIGYLPEHMSVYRRHTESMYASVEMGSTRHRAIWGLDELRTYVALDKHFKGKYHSDLKKLANGVFADFLRVYIENDDDVLLTKGCDQAPLFGKEFLAELKFTKSYRDSDVIKNF